MPLRGAVHPITVTPSRSASGVGAGSCRAPLAESALPAARLGNKFAAIALSDMMLFPESRGPPMSDSNAKPLKDSDSRLQASAKVVAAPWDKSPYYEAAEKFTFIFWDENWVFRSLFEQLDLTETVELACGYGRHAEKIASRCGHLTLVDVFQDNLDHCRERLRMHANVAYLFGNGFDFRPIPDASTTAVFCYDAMVHFSPDLVESYVKDASRILRPGGKILFHLSNYDAPDDRHYGMNPHARNRMTGAMFDDICARAGFDFIENHVIDWSGVDNIDRVALCSKPGGAA
jgi:SAM-dependent methyltransferase